MHRAEYIVDLAHKLLICGVNLTSQKWHFVTVDHSDKITLHCMLEGRNFNNSSGWSLLESTAKAASTASEATAATSITPTETASVTSSEATASSLIKAHICLSVFVLSY